MKMMNTMMTQEIYKKTAINTNLVKYWYCIISREEDEVEFVNEEGEENHEHQERNDDYECKLDARVMTKN